MKENLFYTNVGELTFPISGFSIFFDWQVPIVTIPSGIPITVTTSSPIDEQDEFQWATITCAQYHEVCLLSRIRELEKEGKLKKINPNHN